MAKLVWDQTGERLYETGVKKGVLFPMKDTGEYAEGVAWNGLTSYNESPEGGEPSPFYADDTKYLNLPSNEEFNFSIGAYTYPDEFEACNGAGELIPGVTIGQQARQQFGFSCVTTIGNDVKNADYGYKIHLIYGCLASPSAKDYSTINDSPEATEMSWDVSTTPVTVDGFKPTAHLVINSTKFSTAQMAKLEAVLYGDGEETARLPLPAEVADLLAEATGA